MLKVGIYHYALLYEVPGLLYMPQCEYMGLLCSILLTNEQREMYKYVCNLVSVRILTWNRNVISFLCENWHIFFNGILQEARGDGDDDYDDDDTIIMMGKRQLYLPGVGITKAPFVNFSVSKIFDLAKVRPSA